MRVSSRTRAADVSPFRAAVTDTVIVFILGMVGIFGIVPLYNAIAHTNYLLASLGVAIISEGWAALFMGAVTLGLARGLRERRPNAVRSTALSATMSILVVLVVGVLAWLTSGIVAAGAAAFLLMPLGYRWLGFVEPKGRSNRDS